MKPIPAVYIPVPSPFTTLEDFIGDSATTYNLDLFSCRHSEPHVESVPTSSSIDLNSSIDRDKPIGRAAKGGGSMREALQLYKDHFPRITAILVGTRRTDPHGGKFYQIRLSTEGIYWHIPLRGQLTYPIEIWQILDGLRSSVSTQLSTGLTPTFGRSCADLMFRIALCMIKGKTSRSANQIQEKLISSIWRYTSLGSTYNTFPNPALLIASSHMPETPPTSFTPSTTLASNTHVISEATLTPTPNLNGILPNSIRSNVQLQYPGSPPAVNAPQGDSKAIRYKPAYELQDGTLERSGRGITVTHPTGINIAGYS